MTRSGERGGASLVAVGLAAVVVVLGLIVADVGAYLGARARAATAADAAALAAAPVTFADFGATRLPSLEAARLAAANDAVLVSCECSIDRTWRPRTVRVVVVVPVDLTLFGRHDVPALSRAEFDPTRLPAQ